MVQQEIQNEKPTSSSKVEPSESDVKEIEELMSNGKRHLICNEPQLALDFFVEVCEKLSLLYGQTADECAEAYLYYGKTLLEIARLENGVLGHAIKETPVLGEDNSESEQETKTEGDIEDDVTEEKRNEIRAEVEHALRDGNLYNDASTEEDTEDENDDSTATEKTTDMKDNTESTEQTTQEKVEDTTPSEEASGNSTKNESETTSNTKEDVEMVEGEDLTAVEDEVSNMQLSWEMFELTCFICNRQIKRAVKTSTEPKKFLAEAKYGLAQISLESEHYAEAVKDFTTCLELYKEILEDKQDRRIAEVLYNIGLALSFDLKFTEAIEKYEEAVSLLHSRIKCLEQQAEELKTKQNEESKVEELNKEISELKDLVSLDLMAKIDDAKEMKKQAAQTKEALKIAAKEMFTSFGTSSTFDQGFDAGFDQGFTAQCEKSDEGVHDISNKVRSSKRKPEDEAPASEVDKKKMKTDDEKVNGHTNGHAGEANGHTNGHVNGTEVQS